MSALFALPTDLLHLVFREWLLVKDLVGFDSACSRSVRLSYLSLIRGPVFIIPKVTPIDESSLAAFISWVHIRSTKLGALSIQLTHLKACAGITFYSLETVHTLEIQAKRQNAFHFDQFIVLVKLMPSLTSLSLVGVDHVPDNAHLVFLTALPKLRLKHVWLDRSLFQPSEWANSCVNLDPFLARFSADLVTLNLGGRAISEDTLKLICVECTRVEKLEFNCECISAVAMVTYLGSDCLPFLDALDVFDLTFVLDDAALVEIAKHHSPLVRMHIYWDCDESSDVITAFSCSAILIACPAMCWLRTYAYAYQYGQKKGHNLDIEGMVLTKYDQSIDLYAFPRPLRRVDVESDDLGSESLASFLSLSKACGKDIEDLHLSMINDADDTNMCQIVACLPAIKDLYLYGSGLSDAVLIAIADNCTCMENLHISTGATNLTAGAWCYLFRAIGYNLESLGMSCRNYSGDVLDDIADNCPNLRFIGIKHSNPSVYQDFVDHWIIPKRMPNLKGIQVDCAMWKAWRK